VQTVLLLLLLQGLLGAFDTLWFHEWKGRLPSQPSARLELRLHAVRDFIYATIFGTLGWVAWHGGLAWLLLLLLASEIGITLWDFVEEDHTRHLAPGERVTHALMGMIYGAFLASLLPELWHWLAQPTAFAPHPHGPIAWLLSAMATGVALSGMRDLGASFYLPGVDRRSHEPASLSH
jgi:hypothetical protein